MFVWHLKKCSLALYFRRLDSSAEAATWHEEAFSNAGNIGCELIIHLLVDLDSFVVILQSGCVLGNLEGVHVMSLETGKPEFLLTMSPSTCTCWQSCWIPPPWSSQQPDTHGVKITKPIDSFHLLVVLHCFVKVSTLKNFVLKTIS